MPPTAFDLIAPVATLVFRTLLGGCGGANMQINRQDGVPLSEVEIAGPPHPKWC